jgi:hypothetical protein
MEKPKQSDLLLLSNSNLFSFFMQRFLKKRHKYTEFNVRYVNENISYNEHMLQQIEDLFTRSYYMRGLAPSPHEFEFHDRLTNRFEQVLQQHNYAMILFELKTLKENEWKLLNYIQEHHDLPVTVFTPTLKEENKEMKLLSRLKEYGVSEVITRYDMIILEKSIRRFLPTH